MSGREEGGEALDIRKSVEAEPETQNWSMMCQEGQDTGPQARILSYC